MSLVFIYTNCSIYTNRVFFLNLHQLIQSIPNNYVYLFLIMGKMCEISIINTER